MSNSKFFFDVIKDKEGISIMADKGFIIRTTLKEIKVGLNIPAFLNKKQLPQGVLRSEERFHLFTFM